MLAGAVLVTAAPAASAPDCGATPSAAYLGITVHLAVADRDRHGA